MVMPRMTVLPPPFAPARYGLQSVVIARADGRSELGGVSWQSEACGVPDADYWVDPATAASPPTTDATVAIAWVAIDATTARLTATVTSGSRRTITIDGSTSATVTRGAATPITVADAHSGVSTGITVTVPAVGGSGPLTTVTLPDVPTVKDIPDGSSDAVFGGGEPFTIFHSLQCGEANLADARTRLEREFAAREPYLVERAFWEGIVQDGSTRNTPNLAATTTITSPARSAGIIDAVARLEEEFYTGSVVAGVIHAPRWVYAFAAAAGLVVRERNTLKTPADTAWAFGAGYNSFAGPTAAGGTTAAPGEAWMYMTGPVSQWRTDTQIIPGGTASFDYRSNRIEMLAERTYVLATECEPVATLATFPAGGGAGAGGGGGF